MVEFLEGLDLDAAARFDTTGAPVDGRAAQGDAAGWVDRGRPRSRDRRARSAASPWRGWPTTRRKSPATTSGTQSRRAPGPASLRRFEGPRGLDREADSGSGLDAAAAWAVMPFRRQALIPAARTTLLRLAASRGRFGITPSENWPDEDPWTAPTAWCAWSLAALGERRPALELMAALRRAATPLGLLPGAGRRPNRHPALDDAAGLVARLRDPRPTRALALTRSPPYSRTMEVRPATLEDCAAIARGMMVVVDEGRWLETEPSVDPGDLEQRFRFSVESDEHRSFVLIEDGEVVGALGLNPTHAPGVLALGMWVLPERRGQGGGRLLAEAALESRPADVHKIELDVFTDNEAAIGLYRSLGFEEEGLRRDHYRREDGSLRSALIMARLF